MDDRKSSGAEAYNDAWKPVMVPAISHWDRTLKMFGAQCASSLSLEQGHKPKCNDNEYNLSKGLFYQVETSKLGFSEV